MDNLGDEIRTARKAKSLTQTDLAEMVGVGQTTVAAWEKNKGTSQIRDWERVADALDIPRSKFSGMMAEGAIVDGKQRLSAVVKEAVAPIRAYRNSADDTPKPSVTIRAERAPVLGNRDVPVYGLAQGGDTGKFEFNGEIMGWETRPPQLEGVRNAYAIYVDGDSMYPRYKSGETVWVNPSRPPARGDDVIVQLHPDSEDEMPYGFIKEFVKYAHGNLVVSQHNPSKELSFNRDRVKSIHVIVFSQR